MKKLIIVLGVLTVSLTSCLKDKPNVDFSNISAFAEFVHSGLPYFGADAITDGADANGNVTRDFQINITGEYPPTKDVVVTIAPDNSFIGPYNTANPVVLYDPMPTGTFSFSATSVTIKAGTRLATLTLTVKKGSLDPSKSYMLPVKIASATGVSTSANFNVHYFHFIGNDFAGAYKYDYTRYNNDSPTGPTLVDNKNQAGAILPITPTEFQMETGYNNNHVKYDITFTRTVTAGVVTYSNWKVKFDAASVATGWTPNTITATQGPTFKTLDPANKVFEIEYQAFNGSNFRYIIDKYHKN